MTSRARRHLVPFGLAALFGLGLQAAPLAAQSYLGDDNSAGSVTVDYSALGGGMGGPSPVTRGILPGNSMPIGGCSCAGAPMGVIAAAPRPTFNNPFGANLVMQAPAVPPGFMTYAQAAGAPAYAASSGGAIVLRAPSGSAEPQMSDMPTPAPIQPVETTPALPATTETANAGAAAPVATTEPAQTQTAELPKSTQTQSQPAAPVAEGGSAAATGTEIAPAQPDTIPQSIPSPAPQDQVPVAEAPAQQPSVPIPSAGTENTQSTEPTPPPVQPSTEQQAAVTPTPPPAAATEGSATPPAPQGGTTGENPTPDASGALPAGAYRIVYTGDTDEVPGTSTADLDKVAAEMQSDQNLRMQILAYAAGTEETESKARRKSLARGLAIRSYLIKAGVPSTRLDVRALGSKSAGGPADRVDVIPAS